MVLLLVILLMIYNVLSKLPFSVCYDGRYTMNDLVHQNQRKTSEALQYLRNSNHQSMHRRKENTLDLVIGIVTVKRAIGREELGYLTQVLSKTLQLNDGHNSDVFICNVHPGPGTHREADDLVSYATTIKRFPNHTVEHVVMDPFDRERSDYVYCLEQALSFNTEFVVLLQDDAIPKTAFFSQVAKLLMSTKMEQQFDHLHSHAKHSWDAIKLYYPERWQGFTLSIRHVCELFTIGYICGLFAASLKVAYVQFCRRFVLILTRHSYFNRHRFKTHLLVLTGALMGILLALASGRQHVIQEPLNYFNLYSLIPRYDCCSPGVLYTRRSVFKVIQFLNQTQCSGYYPVDVAMEQLFTDSAMDVLSIQPNILHHIGFISTIKSANPHPEEFMLI